jgi:hypothetical protein
MAETAPLNEDSIKEIFERFGASAVSDMLTAEEHGGRSDPPLEDIPLPKKTTATSVAAAYAHTPDSAKLLLQAPAEKPPLLPSEQLCTSCSPYDMGPDNAGPVEAFVVVKGASFNIQVPLRMVQYKKPSDSAGWFDPATCRKVDAENDAIGAHNRYITSLLSLFVKENGCGTSAGRLTMPSPPDSMSFTRSLRLTKLFKDKYASTVLAVRYLAERKLYAGADYDIENAVDKANDACFAEGVAARIAKGKTRFRIVGSPPASWTGLEEDRDSQGRRVKWHRGKNHSFVSPEISVDLAKDEVVPVENS